MDLEEELQKAAEDGELVDRMEDIIERKVDERVKRRLEEETETEESDGKVTCREFLKKIGVGDMWYQTDLD